MAACMYCNFAEGPGQVECARHDDVHNFEGATGRMPTGMENVNAARAAS